MTGATQRVADALRDAIEAGTYPPGGALPSSEDLAKAHGVAKVTAQKAVNQLAAEGYLTVVRRQPARVAEGPRRLSVVRDRKVYRDQIGYYFDQNAKPWGAIGTPTRGVATPPAHIADLLGTPRGRDVMTRTRLMAPKGSKVAHQVAISYIPVPVVAEVPAVGSSNTGPGGIYDRFEEHYGGPLEWRETVSARQSTSEEQTQLQIPANSSVLVVTREARIASGRTAVVVEVNETTMSAARFAVSYPIERDSSAGWSSTGGPRD
ncbi:GntR family transcriptional regulator [Streptomyces sp. NPDC087850]|uniref:GntR family transcriptional regulator n=1 Tax=Streptomyces sp. NPDC087850 TaxID=3365809 RepID=UPI00381A92AB